MREVSFWEYVNVPGKLHYEKGPIQYGLFHQFGVNFEEYEAGPGNFTTAIIEIHSGALKNIPVEHVTFLEPSNSQKNTSAH